MKLILAIALILLCFSNPAKTQTNDWDPKKEIPPVTVIGQGSAQEGRLAQHVELELERTLEYWRKMGLPNPPDLEGVFYIPNYKDIRVLEFVTILNPSIVDVRGFVNQQREHFERSYLRAFLDVLAPKLRADSRELALFVFDQYLQIRLGVQMPMLSDALRLNPTVQELLQMTGTLGSNLDNAYFAAFPKVNLTDILPIKTDDKPVSLLNPSDLNKIVYIERVGSMRELPKTRRIVILPRFTQADGDMKLTTLNDPSVLIHEEGHHMVDTMANEREIHRSLNEVLADYFAYIMLENPRIGEFFAKASGEIAGRLSKNPSVRDQIAAFQLEGLATQGFIRDISEEANMLGLARRTYDGGDYDNGHPLRRMMYGVHQRLKSQNPALIDELNKIVVRTVTEVANLPEIISTRQGTTIWVHNIWRFIASWAAEKVAIRRLQDPKQVESLEIVKRLNEMPTVTKPTAPEADSAEVAELKKLRPKTLPSFMGSDESSVKKVDGGLVSSLPGFITQEDAMALAGFLVDQMKARVEKGWEQKARGIRKAMRPFGWDRSLALDVDFVIPEYIRALYRQAAKVDPSIAQAIRAEAEHILGSPTVLVDTGLGFSELFFLKSSADKINFVARGQAKRLFSRMASIRKELENPNLNDKQREKLITDYGWALDKIQQYERTGATFRIFAGHPFLQVFSPLKDLVLKWNRRSCRAAMDVLGQSL
ncbi:MAG: hypothetical protein IT289_08785 [Oligoflexia bacterium]|nr:hypothetical protein [Oligoflexia bacterium]